MNRQHLCDIPGGLWLHKKLRPELEKSSADMCNDLHEPVFFTRHHLKLCGHKETLQQHKAGIDPIYQTLFAISFIICKSPKFFYLCFLISSPSKFTQKTTAMWEKKSALIILFGKLLLDPLFNALIITDCTFLIPAFQSLWSKTAPSPPIPSLDNNFFV